MIYAKGQCTDDVKVVSLVWDHLNQTCIIMCELEYTKNLRVLCEIQEIDAYSEDWRCECWILEEFEGWLSDDVSSMANWREMGQNKHFFQIKDSEIANLFYVKILPSSYKQLWFFLYEETIILKLRNEMFLLEHIFGVQINLE